MTSPIDSTEGYVTNVTGGAFMPDLSEKRGLLYSLYDKGKYSIVILERPFNIDDDYIGYGKDYHLNNQDFSPPIVQQDDTKAISYKDQFPNMFILPKVMFDYGTLKPGLYFSSNEIINRLSLFGGAPPNSERRLMISFDEK